MLQRFSTVLSGQARVHAAALACALCVGVLYVAPHVFFMVSLGDAYRGIPMMLSANEDEYLMRIQEIIDGHPSLGSPVFYEYKNEPPLSPPVGEFFYALPTLIFGVSPVTTLIASKFFLPALLFLLVYSLVWRLSGTTSGATHKLTALAAACFITLGYDLIDYRTIWSFLIGAVSPGSSLLWSRPVNPILGALFLFSFLLSIFALCEGTRRRKTAVVFATIFLVCMFGSYFFSWGVAVSVLAVLTLLLLVRREYKTAGTLALIVPLSMLCALPYFIAMWSASGNPWYETSLLRSGLFLTHYPLWNKLLLTTLFFFLAMVAVDFFLKKRKGIAFRFVSWHWFCLSLLFGGLWVYMQQLVTGRTVWPYHFVQYTIPLSIVVGMTVLEQSIRQYSRYLYLILISITILSSVTLGIYTQVSVYAKFRPYYVELQHYGALFTWLNAQESDCVVLQTSLEEHTGLDHLIPAFTHCNLYDSTSLYSLLPEERILHNYLVRLYFRGVDPNAVEEFIHTSDSSARDYLSSNWKGVFGVTDFPDFSDPLFEERLKAFPQLYREFTEKDFATELKKYRLDYIVIKGMPSTNAENLVRNRDVLYSDNDFRVYRF